MAHRIIALIVLVLVGLVAPAKADVINVLSYSMNNGNANPGDNAYLDAQYKGTSPAGNSTTAGAALTGGTGLLTNGVIPTEGYGVYGTYGASIGLPNLYATGQGPFVGWQYVDPIITFHLQPGSLVQQIAIFANFVTTGLAGPIGAVSVNGQLVSLTRSAYSYANEELLIPISGALSSETDFVIQLFRGPLGPDSIAYHNQYPNDTTFNTNSYDINKQAWILVSEVEFLTAVPEVSTWIMMLLGFAALAMVAHRRRRAQAKALAAC